MICSSKNLNSYLISDYINKICNSSTVTARSIQQLSLFFEGLASANLLVWLGNAYFLSNLYNNIDNLIGFNGDLTTNSNNPIFDSTGVTFEGVRGQGIQTSSFPPGENNSRCIISVINDSLSTSSSLAGFWTYGADGFGTGVFLWREGGGDSLLFDYSSGVNLGYYPRQLKWYINAFQYSQQNTESTAWANGKQILSAVQEIGTILENPLSLGQFWDGQRNIAGQINLILWFNRELTSDEHIFISNLLKNTICNNLSMNF